MSRIDNKRSRKYPEMLYSDQFGTIALDFLRTGEEHSCSYLPGKIACEEVFHTVDLPPNLYHDFMDCGFRRSGLLIYRPICPDCDECKQMRIPVNQFKLSRSQGRVLKKNQDIYLFSQTPTLTTEKISLYSKYLEFQHKNIDPRALENLENFLYSSCVHSVEVEYRISSSLVAVSILDISAKSVSSVYTYYDPALASRSLGTYSALAEIQFSRVLRLPYYYLGYYIADCPSMNYKSRFKPHQILNSCLAWE
jgi:leucyl-tRNA---protein transferase